MLDTLLLDLDGTLLPFNQKEFEEKYIETLANNICPMGLEREPFIKALWAGTKAMFINDGAIANRQAFWSIFSSVMKMDTYNLENVMEHFYETEFDSVRSVLREERDLKPLLTSLREKNYRLVCATQPVFPRSAVATRMKWVGLEPEDFDMVTYYDTTAYCKPNEYYYKYIFDAMEKTPDQCIMIGNDPIDDMLASNAGCDTFLVTDYLHNMKNRDVDNYRHGTFADVCKLLNNLPALEPEEEE